MLRLILIGGLNYGKRMSSMWQGRAAASAKVGQGECGRFVRGVFGSYRFCECFLQSDCWYFAHHCGDLDQCIWQGQAHRGDLPHVRLSQERVADQKALSSDTRHQPKSAKWWQSQGESNPCLRRERMTTRVVGVTLNTCKTSNSGT